MNLKEITDQLRDATHDKLLVLADWCQSEATKRDPVKIAYEKKMAESNERERRNNMHEDLEIVRRGLRETIAYQCGLGPRPASDGAGREYLAGERALIVKLKKFIKPGMKIKMKGCKDGHGIREFIRWENDQLVCWQIKVRLVGPSFVRQEDRTNQVTTHMANKVQQIFVDGTGLCVKSILN